MEINKNIKGLAPESKQEHDGLRPVDYLIQNLAEARRLNQGDEENLSERTGKRYRDLIHQFVAVYPREVPFAIHLPEGIVAQPHTMTGYNRQTLEGVSLTGEFWSRNGYDLVQRVILANNG